MAAVQLSFAIRTTSSAKTVHLVGNWDGYKTQLPLSKDASKSGSWKGTFRFQGASLKPGQRYWYYYIIDGYMVSHDPAKPSTVEPTTKRPLNILDVPSQKPALAPLDTTSSSSRRAPRSSQRQSAEVAKGRALSPSRIVCPRPVKPNAARRLEAAAAASTSPAQLSADALSRRLAHASLHRSSFESDSESESDDDASDVPSLSSSRSSSSAGSRGFSPVSPSSSVSSPVSCCTCERFGITRDGRRVRLDCGGKRCGLDFADDAASSCASDESDDEYYKTRVVAKASKRNGILIRGSPRRL